MVADAINTLSAAGKVSISNLSTGVLFPRPTGTPEVLHGDGSPEGLIYAGQGSLFLRRDSAAVYQKATGIHLNTGWATVKSSVFEGLFSAGPPSNPGDGDVWRALAVDTGNLASTSGMVWQFRYNAFSGSTYKWEFIGGSELRVTDSGGVAVVNTCTQVGSSGYWYKGTTYTTVRAGDYALGGFINIDPGTVLGQVWIAGFQGSGVIGSGQAAGETLDTSPHGEVSADPRPIAVGVAASTAIGLCANVPGAGFNRFDGGVLTVLPIRVS